LQMVCDAKTPI